MNEATQPEHRGSHIKANLHHGAGAYARCSYCQRYSDDPATLGDRPPACDCGEKRGWSGSFVPPTAESKWSGTALARRPAAAGVADAQIDAIWDGLIDGHAKSRYDIARAILALRPSPAEQQPVPQAEGMEGDAWLKEAERLHDDAAHAFLVYGEQAEEDAVDKAASDAARAALLAHLAKRPQQADPAPNITSALNSPACTRLAEWAAIGPVQRAAVEHFADLIAGREFAGFDAHGNEVFAYAEPTARTPQDYAIEHAEYMAKKAEHLLTAIEALSAAELALEESDETEDQGAVADARDVVWDAHRSLNAGIYEFRKRRDRAAAMAQGVKNGD